MKQKLNIAAAIVLVAMMLAVGCGAQDGKEKGTGRFTEIKGSSVDYDSKDFTDRHSGCKYATIQDGGGRVMAAVPLYGADGKPLGCGEK